MKYIFEYASPLGKIFIGSDGKFLTGLWFEYSFDEKKHAENSAGEVKKISADSVDSFTVISKTCRWLDVYFSGREPDFTPEFKIENLTPFRKLVVDEMLKIPFGATTTYGEIAKNIAAQKGLKKMSRRRSAELSAGIRSALSFRATGFLARTEASQVMAAESRTKSRFLKSRKSLRKNSRFPKAGSLCERKLRDGGGVFFLRELFFTCKVFKRMEQLL